MKMERNLSELSISEKREYLAKLLNQYVEDSPNIYPLSFGQESLWFIYQVDPRGAAYNLVLPLKINSKIDKSVLKISMEALIKRHPMLRASFKTDKGYSYQKVNDKLDFVLLEEDFSDVPEADITSRIREIGQQPFNLSTGPVFRVWLVKWKNDTSILVFTVHHIVSDFWSLRILLGEVIKLYQEGLTNNSIKLPAAKFEYPDFCKWQRDMVKGPDGERLLSFWKKELNEVPFSLTLPTDKPWPASLNFLGAIYPLRINKERVATLNELSKAHGTTVFTTTLSVFQLLIYLWTRQDDFVIGCPTSGRTKPEFEQVFGYFVNSVVVRADFKNEKAFDTFLKVQQERMINVLNHQDYPFQQLVQLLNPVRNPFRTPLFQVSFQCDRIDFTRKEQTDISTESGLFEDAGAKEGFLNISYNIKADGLDLEYLDIPQTVGQFDLMIRLFNTGETIGGTIDYNADIFEEKTIALFAQNYLALLDIVLANPKILLNDPGLEQLFDSHKEIYWRNKLKDIVPLNFPADFSRSNIKKSFSKNNLSRSLDQKLANNLQIFCKEKGYSLFTLTLSVCKVLLYRYCNQEDIWLKTHDRENGDLIIYSKVDHAQKINELLESVAADVRESVEQNVE